MDSVVPAISQIQTHLIDDSSLLPETGHSDDSTHLLTMDDLSDLLCTAVANKSISHVILNFLLVIL